MKRVGQRGSVAGEILKAGAALGIVVLIAIAGWNFLRSGGANSIVSLANWRLVSQHGDDSCSRIGDYCAHVECTLRNDGSGSGSSLVVITLMQGSRTPFESTQQVFGAPGEIRVVSHDFPEADLFDSTPQFTCSAH